MSQVINMPKKTRIAIIYDFDKTLSTSDMQNSLIENLGLSPKDFWNECAQFAKENGMGKIPAYLYVLKSKLNDKSIALNSEVLKKCASEIEYFPGVVEWFDLISEFAKEQGVIVEHYIISSGMKEILENTQIFKKFEEVYACEYLYDEYGCPVWVKNDVDFTTKTQFLFRINKKEHNVWDDKGVNQFIEHDLRPIPFTNMIYIGDGTTDIPCMKLVKNNGGYSIGVYSKSKSTVNQLIYDDRVNLICKADYTNGGDLYRYVTGIIRKVAAEYPLTVESRRQYEAARKYLEKKD